MPASFALLPVGNLISQMGQLEFCSYLFHLKSNNYFWFRWTPFLYPVLIDISQCQQDIFDLGDLKNMGIAV